MAGIPKIEELRKILYKFIYNLIMESTLYQVKEDMKNVFQEFNDQGFITLISAFKQ